MPIPTERPSIKTDLASRYATQPAGGAFNAKEVKEQPIDFGLNEKKYETDAGWPEQTQGVSNFKGANVVPYTEISSMASGLDTTKYKG